MNAKKAKKLRRLAAALPALLDANSNAAQKYMAVAKPLYIKAQTAKGELPRASVVLAPRSERGVYHWLKKNGAQA